MFVRCKFTELHNESDVESKLIMPLLTDALLYQTEEIFTKMYLAPRDIDKGAGKRIGYFPDYAIMLSGLFCLIVEAKAPNESVEEGYRESQLYAHQINTSYPQDLNPVKYVISCNGRELLFGSWDSAPLIKLPFEHLNHGTREFEQFVLFVNRNILFEHSHKLRAQLAPNIRYKPLKLLGGPSRQNQEVKPNQFANELYTILREYFDPETTRSSIKIIEKAYVSSSEVTHYDTTLESLLRDNIARKIYPSHIDVETDKNKAPVVSTLLTKSIDNQEKKENLVLLIGAVGSGKSTFIERYYHFLLTPEMAEKSLWIYLDMNYAPNNQDLLNTWIYENALLDLEQRNGIKDFYVLENLKRYFAPAIRKKQIGPYSHLKPDSEELDKLIRSDISNWMENKQLLFESAMRYYGGDKRYTIITVFDNADKRDGEQQLSIFQEVQSYKRKYQSFCMLSLRDETYDRYKTEPPLDAFFTPLVFRISPPRFIDVVKRRLKLVIDDITAKAPERLSYTMAGGITVEYPKNDLGRYLFGVYKSLFTTERKIRLILEALAGRNVRNALEMFVDMLMSGYMDEHFIFSSRYTDEKAFIPDWLLIRILMRTKYRYYSSDRGSYIFNLLDVSGESPTLTNFINCEVLCFLSSARKKRFELGIEGYVSVAKLIQHCVMFGYSSEDVFMSIHKLLARGLVISDNQSLTNIDRENYLKITASGHYHQNFLLEHREYLANIALDTNLRDKELANTIASNSEDNLLSAKKRVIALKQALGIENAYLKQQTVETMHEDTAQIVDSLLEKTAAEMNRLYQEIKERNQE